MLRRGNGRLIGPAAALGSGLLLAGAFPPLGWSGLAWVALVPLLLAIRTCSPRKAAALGWWAGVVAWHVSLAWLQRVTTAGWIGLSLYCALYPAAFAALYAGWRRALGPAGERWAGRLATMVVVTVAWTGLDYLRSVLFTGFPWNGLGVSQYRHSALIQSADWGGVFAVTALLAWVNAGVAGAAERAFGRASSRSRISLETMLVGVAVLGALGYGRARLARLPEPNRSVRPALVQPAIPQYEKWTESFVAETYRRLETLSEAALSARPELLIWPETAVADVLRSSPEAYALVRRVTAAGVPLLVGALDEEREDSGAVHLYNSAFLLGADGSLVNVYDKRHLVLFGEYIPFGDRFPWLRSLSPIAGDVTPGKEPGLFRLEPEGPVWGILICFEDTVPALARDLAAGGAHLFVTLTNDAWFDFSSGSLQHLAQSVFRCVEQRRPMARCANSGITAWIDAAGRIGGTRERGPGVLPHYGEGPTALSGFLLAEIPIHDPLLPPTVHARFGDWFGKGCAVAGLVMAAGLLRFRARKEPASTKEPRG